MSGFVASWGGKCAACGERICVGDMCTYVDGSVVHVECTEVTQPHGVTERVCGQCFLTACDCGR